MNTSAETDQLENSLRVIRKLRKKLRQIERLEKTERDLTPEEAMKLACKHDIRANLQLLLSVMDAANLSFDSTKSEDSIADEDHNNVDLAGPELVETKIPIKDSDASYSIELRAKEKKCRMPSSERAEDEKIVAKKKPKLSEAENVVDDKPSKAKKAVKLRPKLRKTWRNSEFEVTALDGHHDNILAADADDKWVVSASRDTALKLWDVESCSMIRSMGGHSEAVTAVVLLSADLSDALRHAIDRSSIEIFADLDKKECENERMAISGSTDCTIRLWLLPRGLCIKSLYNYNPVSAISYYEFKKFIFVGSTSGNLTVYNLCTSQQIYSSTIHRGQITQLKISQDKLYSSSAVGSIKIWNIYSKMQEKEKAENLRFCNLEFEVTSEEFGISEQYCYDTHSQYLPDREINSFTIYKNKIYFGDDGPNIKTIDLNSDKVCKMRNQKLNVPGITDSLTVSDELLLSTSYNLDTGTGSINVRSLHDECYGSYVASFCHSNIPRLLSMVVRFQNEDKYIVTAGEKLLLWKLRNQVKKSDEREHDEHTFVVKGQNVADLGKIATDSDNPSDYESSETELEGKWWWQKQAPVADPNPTDIQQEEEDDVDSEDGTECNESSNSIEDSRSATRYFSLWDWCNLI